MPFNFLMMMLEGEEMLDGGQTAQGTSDGRGKIGLVACHNVIYSLYSSQLRAVLVAGAQLVAYPN